MSRIALFVLVTVFAIVFAISLTSAGAMQSSIAKLNTPDDSRTTAHARIDAHGIVRAMYNIRTRATGTTPEEIARNFLQTNGDAFHISNTTMSLRAGAVQTIPGGSHVRFTQTLDDVPVFRGDVVVSINTTGQVTMVVNNFKDGILVPSTIPSLSETDALQRRAPTSWDQGPNDRQT